MLAKVAATNLTARDMYRRSIGYDPSMVEDEEEEESDTEPAAIIAERDPLLLGERFAPSFHDFLCQTCLIVGIRRSGKSTLLLALIEELAKYSLPFVLFDTMGEYYGLVNRHFLVNPRLAGNVERMHDIPQEARPFLANITTENAYGVGQAAVKHVLQLVVDLKGYDDDTAALIMSEIVDGVNDWQEARVNQKHIPFTFAIDEGQKWFPQEKADRSPDIKPDTQAVLDEAFHGTVVARGGKNGLGFIVATQRYSQLSKKLLQSSWKFYLRQTEEIDLARYRKQGIDPQEAKMLGNGECIVYGPGIQHVRFQARLGRAVHEGHTPDASALAKYTRELNFSTLQKTGAFLDDMDLEQSGRTANRTVSPDRPDQGKNRGLSVVRTVPKTSEERPNDGPEYDLDEPGDGAGVESEATSEAFQPRDDDLLLSDLQSDLLVLFYSNPKSSSYGNVERSLAQIKNEKGQGLGGRYKRHASSILEQRGLKKVKKA
jgi:hypothetical protein